jgi:hypothetical protein
VAPTSRGQVRRLIERANPFINLRQNEDMFL